MARQTREETREDILGAASALFTTQGFLGTSLQDIAREVGYSKAALLYHFDTKAAILSELIRPGMIALAALHAEVSAMPAGTEAQRRARALYALEGFIALAVRHRRACAVIFGNHTALFEDPQLAGLQAAFEQLVAAMAPDPENPRDRLVAVVAVSGIAGACSEAGAADVPDDVLRSVLRDVAHRLLS